MLPLRAMLSAPDKFASWQYFCCCDTDLRRSQNGTLPDLRRLFLRMRFCGLNRWKFDTDMSKELEMDMF